MPMPNPVPAAKATYDNAVVLKQVSPGQYTIKVKDQEVKVQLEVDTEAYGPDGKKAINGFVVMVPGSVVNLKVEERPKAEMESILEVRMVKPPDTGEPTPNPPKDVVTAKGAVYMGQVGEKGRGKSTFKAKDGSLIHAEPGVGTKAFDQDGKEVPFPMILKVGNAYDLVVQPGPMANAVTELRLVKPDDKTPAGAWAEVVALKTPNLNYANYGVTVSPDGKHLALTTGDVFAPEMSIIDVATKKAVKSWKVPTAVQPVIWSADGTALAGIVLGNGDTKSRIIVWETKTWTERAAFEVAGFPGALALSGDGNVVATAFDSFKEAGALKAWDVSTKKEIYTQDLKGGTPRIALSADGKKLACHPTGGLNVQVFVVDLSAGKVRVSFPATGHHIAFAEDGNTLVEMAYLADGLQINVWDVRGPAPKSVKVIKGGRWKYDTFTLIDKGRHLALGGGIEKDEVRLYNLATGELAHTHAPSKAAGPGRRSLVVGTVPDSSLLLTLGTDNTVRLWTTPFAPKP
jgi:hypothetical protein